MCGIVAKLDLTGRPVPASLIASMCKTLVHRGPDDEGIQTTGPAGLGQRRLAILDLDRRATAPLFNEDGSVCVTFNGEIYNFRELRQELLAKGHTLKTQGDTEVLVHLYEELGPAFVQRLRGMFALVIWDARRQHFFAARDRLGKKPLHYARTPRSLVIASEIKGILADPDITVAPNYRAIDEYLTYQYVPSPLTAFEGICKLPPGHTLTCDLKGNITVERYWAPPMAPKSSASEEELADELRSRLREAVGLRLVADVPVGAFLSGGIDSSAVVALMAEQTAGAVRTFSIGFEEQSHDELSYARLVAQRYGTDHHEFIVRADATEVLPLLVRHYNEPFADSSALPTYYVAKMTREHVTVALSGDGGDENFAGYENYAAVAAWSRLDAIPAPLRTAVGSAMMRIIDRAPYSSTTERASRAFAMLAAQLPQRFRLQSTIFKPREKQVAYAGELRALLGSRESSPVDLPWSADMDPLDWMMRHDQSFYLADCLMVKTDIASMANSLEIRCPLLDHELVEFAATIPSSMKRDAHGGKRIFKRAVQDLVPAEILNKPKKGFGVPLDAWFRGELAPMLRGVLLDERARARNLFEPSFVARLVDEHVSGRRNWSHRLWALLFLELWFREFID